MPTNSTISRRRARSRDIPTDHAELRRVRARRDANARMFDDRVLEENVGSDDIRWSNRIMAHAANRSFIDYMLTADEPYSDLLYYLNSLRYQLQELLTHAWSVSPYGGVSFNLEVEVLYYALDDENITSLRTLHSGFYPIFTMNDIILSCTAAVSDILNENEYYQEGRSNWVIESIYHSILKYQFVKPSNVLQGGGRFHNLFRMRGAASYIKEPEWLMRKKCLVNIQNKDDLCFKYVMECAFIHRTAGAVPRNCSRPALYSARDTFNYDNLTFPIHLLDIELFERQNMSVHNLALHVYFATSTPNDIGVLYSSRNMSPDAWHVELLIIVDEKEGVQTNSHWIYITKFDRFLCNDKINKNMKRVFCRRCTQDFSPKELQIHEAQCGHNVQGTPVMPYPYEKYKYFKDMDKTFRPFFTIYADFEAFNVVRAHTEGESKSDENRLTEHVCASFCFHTVCRTNPSLNRTFKFSYNKSDLTEPDLVAKKFLEELDVESARVHFLFQSQFLHPLDQSSVSHTPKSNWTCAICKLNLTHGFMPHWTYKNFRPRSSFKSPTEYFQRLRSLRPRPLDEGMQEILFDENRRVVDVWDSSQPKDNFIGRAHFACAAHRPEAKAGFKLKIPVFFHNLSNYDAHFILKAIDSTVEQKSMQFSGIPKSSDKFMSFSFHGLRYIDTIRFMNTSLDALSTNLLRAGKEKFLNFNQHFKHLSDEKQALLLQKGEFPYDYFNHPSVFKETQLPAIEHWFNKLRNEEMSHDDFQKAQKVWTELECKTFQDYHDLYLIVDVMLLADVFENFRDLCYNQYGVDPANYISLPGMCMDASFRFCGSRWDGPRQIPFSVDLFDNTQSDMYLFIEDSIRGGVSMTPGRFAKANHKYLDSFKPDELSKYLFYLDANNLYGFAMNQPLPFCDYAWVPPNKIPDLMTLDPEGPVGYIYEVSGYFPDEVHDYLKDFPPAPVKQVVTEEMISPFSAAMNERYGNNHDDKSDKLLCTLEPRTLYKCHYTVLKLYVSLGFKITQTHRVLRFMQSRWLADFINHNTRQRAKATNAFEQDLYKLVNNANYGKYIQNNRKFRTMKVIDLDAPKLSWSPFLTDRRIVNDKFVLGTFYEGKVQLNSAVIVGSCILDHSKWLMYHFYYNVMKAQYTTSLRLIFTDTDSLCMEITHDDPMKDLKDKGILDEWFDLSDFPHDASYYGACYLNTVNKKIIGKFKDEMVSKGKGVYITEVVALRAKMYSCLNSDGLNKKTAKGVTAAARKLLTHAKYSKAVHQDPSFYIESVPMLTFQSSNNTIYTTSTTKATISPCDSKLYLLDPLTTLPYGHYSIPRDPIPSSV